MESKEGLSIYIVSLIITAIIFSAGLMAGYEISKFRDSVISSHISDAELSITDLSIQQEALSLFPEDCQLVRLAINNLVSEMGKIEDELSRMENGREIERIGYEHLRERYQLMSIRYYLYAERFSRCLGNRTAVLYFYTDKCKRCDDQAFILTALKKKYDGMLLVFPVDVSTGIGSAKMLANYYNITSYPSLVVNGNVMGFVPKDELEALIAGRTQHS